MLSFQSCVSQSKHLIFEYLTYEPKCLLTVTELKIIAVYDVTTFWVVRLDETKLYVTVNYIISSLIVIILEIPNVENGGEISPMISNHILWVNTKPKTKVNESV